MMLKTLKNISKNRPHFDVSLNNSHVLFPTTTGCLFLKDNKGILQNVREGSDLAS